MKPDELRALADRVEAAQGADRELDGEISRAIGTPGWRLSDAGRWFQSCLRRAQFAPTSSLDAAVSLVPEGWFPNVWQRSDGISEASAEKDGNETVWGAVGGASLDGMARATAAAALRALAEEATEC
jgi:hypothetical protein